MGPVPFGTNLVSGTHYVSVPTQTEWLLINHEINSTAYLHSIDFYVATAGEIKFEARAYNSLGSFTTAAQKLHIDQNQPPWNVKASIQQVFAAGYQRYYFPTFFQVPQYTIFYVYCMTGSLGADKLNTYTYDVPRLSGFDRMSAMVAGTRSLLFKIYTKSSPSAVVNNVISKIYSAESTYNFKGFFECNGITVSSLVPILVNTSAASQTQPPPVTTTTILTTTVFLGKNCFSSKLHFLFNLCVVSFMFVSWINYDTVRIWFDWFDLFRLKLKWKSEILIEICLWLHIYEHFSCFMFWIIKKSVNIELIF